MWERDQDNLKERFRRAGLPIPVQERIWTKLRSCTLDFWELNKQGWYCTFEPEVFLVASLEELTLRGCRFEDRDGTELLNSPYRGQTALRKLVLERSYIHHTALFNFLIAPIGLTHLTLGHDKGLRHHAMGNQTVNSYDAEDYMAAFSHQKHSLQFLDLGDELLSEIEEGEFNFSTFPKLEDIEYDEAANCYWHWNEAVANCLQLVFEDEEWRLFEPPGG